jgi:hypothetical protein
MLEAGFVQRCAIVVNPVLKELLKRLMGERYGTEQQD